MPNPRERPSIDYLRSLVAVQVEATSLRQVAADVGMSPTGLWKFLSGSDPYSRTRGKLLSWFVRFAAQQSDGLTPDSAVAAVTILTAGLPPEGRRRVVEDIVRSLGEAYSGQGLPRPPWLEAIAELLPAGDDPNERDRNTAPPSP